MPPRPAVLAILLFWLGTTAYLAYRDIWPSVRRGEPPPYTIDLADEARRDVFVNHWRIIRGTELIGKARTSVKYDEASDTFELQSTIDKLELGKFGPLKIGAKGMVGTYWVTREGELRSLAARLAVMVGGVPLLGGEAELSLSGRVEKGMFLPKGSINWNGRKDELPLEPVPVSANGSVLNPLHPVGRISGLRPGQFWRVPLVDPLADSLKALVEKNPGLDVFVKQSPGLRTLQAEVLPEPRTLFWDGRDVACLVIEYRDQDLTAETWVREHDGYVLRQVATLWGERLILERE
jgi:hypothetical protein